MKYLLTGGSGVLGKELKKHLDCWAPPHSQFDITTLWHPEWVKQFDVIIHAAAYTNVPGAEQERRQAVETNITGTKNIFSYGKRVVYISTDYVYAGQKGNYKETDVPAPFNFYGFTKLAGEVYANPEEDLVIRTSFKPKKPWPYPKAFHDLYTSAGYIDEIAPKIVSLIKSSAVGVYNVGVARKSLLELAQQRNPQVGSCSVKEVVGVNLPTDISMNLDKFQSWESDNG